MEKSEPKQYGAFQLLEEDLDADPFRQFGRWYDAASSAGLVHPDAFALATVSGDGKPSARMLLLKGFDQNGFVFFTNSESRKGEDLCGNTNAAICFWWDKLERSVRIEGKVHKVSLEEADIYFATRPR
ncbi:MAG: pyridoxine/pyridoxamine 5'-phosphate oxidase, partial [Thermodesulfobacteriota bacterium]